MTTATITYDEYEHEYIVSVNDEERSFETLIEAVTHASTCGVIVTDGTCRRDVAPQQERRVI